MLLYWILSSKENFKLLMKRYMPYTWYFYIRMWYFVIVIAISKSKIGLIRSILSVTPYAVLCALAHTACTHIHKKFHSLEQIKNAWRGAKAQTQLWTWEVSTQYVCFVYGFDETYLRSSQETLSLRLFILEIQDFASELRGCETERRKVIARFSPGRH